LKIRKATKVDLPGIASLHIQSWRNAYAEVLPKEFLGDPIEREFTRYWHNIDIGDEDVVMVAEDDDLLGFIAVWCLPTPYIDNLHVKPSLHSKGIGSTLLISAAEELLARGHKTAYLWVFTSNQKAVRFYERLGGVTTGNTPQNIFDYSIPSLKIEWMDLAVIMTSLKIPSLDGNGIGSE
jgi:ribosomal protein S18 acetylase RimI-like enzyme